jgi:predicted alpha-1,2-mannosidase
MHRFFAPALLAFTFSAGQAGEADAPGDANRVGYVSTLQGTDSTPGLSHGNTLPLVGMPWGMVDWSLENGTGGWYFRPTGRFDGFRATHQPSPWLGDYGAFVIMPQVDARRLDAEGRTTAYDAASAIFRPDYERLALPEAGLTAELTGTERCGVFRFSFARGDQGRLVVSAFPGSEITVSGRTLRGISRKNGGGVGNRFGSYFIIELDRDLRASEVTTRRKGPNAPAHDDEAIAWVEFATTPETPVTVRVGTSFIGFAQAEQNLKAEAEGGFAAVHQRVRESWNASLDRVAIAGSDEQKRVFYSCLYRAQMFPHRLFELDARGEAVHYSPYDGALHAGALYGDIGIWDGFRTTFPLVTLVYPERMADILEGFTNAAQECGMFMEWPSPGDRGGMGGQHCAAIVADAVAKGVTGFDVPAAYASLLRSASANDGHGARLRNHLDDYLKYGYVPKEVSETLDDAYDDWCIAQLAQQQGHADVAAALLARAQNYRRVWDPAAGFMRPRKADGDWAHPFDEFAWGDGYTEGGPWQGSWFVPHDPAGLASLLGGRGKLVAKMDQMLALPSTYHPGGYHGVIHEMLEMAHDGFGQYAQGNQPSFANLYQFAVAGQPWKTEYWTRRSCAELFTSGVDGFPGDEDNGSLASWYILSAIGLYTFCPGAPQYVLTSPLYRRVDLHLAQGKTFTISAPANDDAHVYVQQRRLDGKRVGRIWIAHGDVVRGGELKVELGTAADQEPVAVQELPYSASK